MQKKNWYYSRSKITEAKFRAVVRCFALDLTATVCAELTGLSVRTTNSLYLRFRYRIEEQRKREKLPISGVVEVDDVYTEIIPNCTRATLRKVIAGKLGGGTQAIIHSDGMSGYDGLVDLGYAQHYRVNHGRNEFACGENHINGIESFWSYAKRRLAKFNGLHKHTFYLHLKETEFRFNHRWDNIYLELLKLFRKYPYNPCLLPKTLAKGLYVILFFCQSTLGKILLISKDY